MDDEQVKQVKKTPERIDPLRRIFIPIEKRNDDGTMSFQTSDKERYVREVSGAIRRRTPKVHGKQARRNDKRGRRQMSDKIIETSSGPKKESELRKITTPDAVEYYLGEELVHRSVEVQLKGVHGAGATAKIG